MSGTRWSTHVPASTRPAGGYVQIYDKPGGSRRCNPRDIWQRAGSTVSIGWCRKPLDCGATERVGDDNGSDTNANRDTDSDTHGDANRDTDSDTNGNANRDTDGNTNGNSDACYGPNCSRCFYLWITGKSGYCGYRISFADQ